MCRQGRVLQDIGVETLRELRTGLCKSEVQKGREGRKEKGVIVKWEKKHQERSVHAYSRHLTTKASVQRIRDNIITSNSSKLAALMDGIFVLACKCANRKKGESCHFPKKKKSMKNPYLYYLQILKLYSYMNIYM